MSVCCIALVIEHAMRMRRMVIHMWPLRLCHIFPHYLTNGKDFGKKLLNIKCVFLLSLQVLSETLLVLSIIQRHTVINAHRSSC